MKINKLNLIEGAEQATGLAVIIDVFRAFSVDCYLFAAGAEKIFPAGTLEEAFSLKALYPDAVLVGERHEQKPEGFDFGNSPAAVMHQDFSGKSVIHTTSAGTQGLVRARKADDVITGSFVNAQAIINYIRHSSPAEVSLVGMGYSAKHPVEEDVYCADYIAGVLDGEEPDFAAMKRNIRETSGARFFILEKQHFAPAEDFDLCMNLNRFNFVVRRYIEGDRMVLRKLTI